MHGGKKGGRQEEVKKRGTETRRNRQGWKEEAKELCERV